MPNLRPDRLLSVGLVRPLLGLVNACAEARVPILMYHGIRKGLSTSRPYFETNTSPDLFASHMRFLHDNGYESVSLRKAVEHTKETGGSPKRVAITFDDGYRDFYTTALPVLARYNLFATVFVVSNYAGQNSARPAGKEFMTWNEVKEIHSQGIEIGSHTASHPELRRLSRRDVESELASSKKAIEDAIGQSIRSFSHPFAFPEENKEFTETLSILLEQCAYERGVTTIIGTAGPRHPRYFLPRLPINSYDDLPFFQAKLEGAYNWLHLAQHLYKSWLKPPASAAATSTTGTIISRD